jgi:hypothetical protein
MLSLVPICATFPADRLLLYAGLGAMGVMAYFIQEVSYEKSIYPPTRLMKALCGLFIILHLILAPFVFTMRVFWVYDFGHQISTSVGEAPLGDDIADKTLVLINSPNIFHTGYFPVMNALEGRPYPKYIRGLGPEMLLSLHPMKVTRTDENSIKVEPKYGYRWFLMRDGKHPFSVGDKVELAGITIEILSLTPRNTPHIVAFHFDRSLDDSSLRWLQYQDKKFIPFTPPGIGETVELNP